ncbi:MAG: thioredoxin domain-containing protein [Propionibacteriaceae bacterium]|nr:thioredoxin domain-containing protein [Propionibacteriaceae bacterium]
MSKKSADLSSRDKLKQQQELTARRARERRLLAIVAVGVVILVVGGGIGLQAWRTQRAPSAVPARAASFAPVTIENGRPIVLGKAEAPVRVQLYEDFHCPHCADFETEFGPTITAEQDAGRLAVELYPMSFIDAGSASAANAMACAAEAGFGQPYYLGLFANHTLQWRDGQLIELAAQVTSNVPDQFNTCVTSKAHQSWADSINAAAQTKGVTSTPTMFLNGNPVDVSGQTPESLKTMIEEAATT